MTCFLSLSVSPVGREGKGYGKHWLKREARGNMGDLGAGALKKWVSGLRTGHRSAFLWSKVGSNLGVEGTSSSLHLLPVLICLPCCIFPFALALVSFLPPVIRRHLCTLEIVAWSPLKSGLSFLKSTTRFLLFFLPFPGIRSNASAWKAGLRLCGQLRLILILVGRPPRC